MASPIWFADKILGPPRSGAGVFYEKPWHGRVFAMAVLLEDQHIFTWDEFRERLEVVVKGRRVSVQDYYNAWLQVLEAIVAEKGVFDASELSDRLQALEVVAGRNK